MQSKSGMRDVEDPKRPRPVKQVKKAMTSLEASEALPWSHVRKDDQRDRHRHV
jgi:hypothetical protein